THPAPPHFHTLSLHDALPIFTDMQAAVGLAQLAKLPDFIAARKQNWQTLRTELERFSDYLVLPEATLETEPSWFRAAMKSGSFRSEEHTSELQSLTNLVCRLL